MNNTRWLIVTFRSKFLELEEIVGGDQIRPYELFSNFAAAGHRVHLWEIHHPEGRERTFYDGKLVVRQIRYRPGLSGQLLQLAEMRNTLRKELAWAKENGYQRICYYQQIPVGVVFRGGLIPMLTHPGILLVGLANRLGMATWGAVHDISPEHEQFMQRRAKGRSVPRYVALKGRLHAWLQQVFLPKVSFVTTVSSPIRELLIERHRLDRKRISVFLSGYNKTLIAEVESWEPRVADTNWTIGYLGSPHDVSLDLLIESIATLGRENVKLLLSGKGMNQMVASIRARWPNIEVIDEVQYSSFSRIANRVDLWVHLFDDQYCIDFAWQLKVPMCLASGRPVVRTAGRAVDQSGMKEYFFLTGTTPEEVARVIAYVLDHPDEAYERAQAGRSFVLENLSWEQLSLEMLTCLEKCASAT